MSSSQLTLIFFRGVAQPPTSQPFLEVPPPWLWKLQEGARESQADWKLAWKQGGEINDGWPKNTAAFLSICATEMWCLRSWRRQHEAWKTLEDLGRWESGGFCGWDMDVLRCFSLDQWPRVESGWRQHSLRMEYRILDCRKFNCAMERLSHVGNSRARTLAEGFPFLTCPRDPKKRSSRPSHSEIAELLRVYNSNNTPITIWLYMVYDIYIGWSRGHIKAIQHLPFLSDDRWALHQEDNILCFIPWNIAPINPHLEIAKKSTRLACHWNKAADPGRICQCVSRWPRGRGGRIEIWV